MQPRRNRRSLCLLLLFALPACSPDKDIEQEIAGKKATYDISATTLCKRYSDSQVSADAKYKGKVLLVTGTVASKERQFNGSMAVMLSANLVGSGVRCFFSRDRAYDADKLNGEVTIRGRCDGWDMGVVLRGCKVVN